MKSYLEIVKSEYDFILIDCMPSLGMITISALAAADSVIVPVQSQYLPAKGMTQLIKTVDKVKKQINPALKIDGVLMTMVDSVKAFGIQTPAVVRIKDDAGNPCGSRYEMVSGHRRKLACELAGLEFLPCIVREMSRDESIIAMVDSNLQREIILPSEKARSYRMKLEAMRRQVGRPSNNCAPVGLNFNGKRSREVLADNSPDSHSQIQRYIRLTELIPQLLDMVDENQLAMRPAVELSYLSQEHQQALLGVIESEDRTPSHIQAVKMRKSFEEESLSNDVILSIMQEDKSNRSEHFKLPAKKIHRFFPANTSVKEIEETIIKALELWQDSNK